MTGANVPADLGVQMAAAVLLQHTGFAVEIVEKEIEDVDVRAEAAALGWSCSGWTCLTAPALNRRRCWRGVRVDAASPSVGVLAEDLPALVDDDDDAVMKDAAEAAVMAAAEDDLDMTYLEGSDTDGQLYLRRGIFCEPLAKFILCLAGMALGKTEQMMALIRYFIERGWLRIVFVTQRRTMVDASMARLIEEAAAQEEEAEAMRAAVSAAADALGFKRYDRDAKGDDGLIDLARMISVVVEYENDLVRGHADLIILDETRSILSAVISKTNGQDGSLINTNYTALDSEDVVMRARKVLCMDADLNFDGFVPQWVTDMATSAWTSRRRRRCWTRQRSSTRSRRWRRRLNWRSSNA
jgi:hypothetical protein